MHKIYIEYPQWINPGHLLKATFKQNVIKSFVTATLDAAVRWSAAAFFIDSFALASDKEIADATL